MGELGAETRDNGDMESGRCGVLTPASLSSRHDHDPDKDQALTIEYRQQSARALV